LSAHAGRFVIVPVVNHAVFYGRDVGFTQWGPVSRVRCDGFSTEICRTAAFPEGRPMMRCCGIAIASSAIALVLAVLAVSTGVEQRIGRLESKIRQAMWSDAGQQ
jgi:hypothetical protein